MTVNTSTLGKKKRARDPIVMVTAYDATLARLIDQAGADVVLVGDSLGMVIQGEKTTLPVTMDDMVYHTRIVRKGVTHAHLVADMPFLSYQASRETAITNAGRLLKEAGAEAVKLEGGGVISDLVRSLVDCGIPVMGHVGLEPQRVHSYGGYKMQGTDGRAADTIREDAEAIATAGAYSLVLEGIPAALAKEISESLAIPTIGIGSGPHCDGQVLVSYDLWGFDPEFRPKFVKTYCDGHAMLSQAVKSFAQDVREGKFPDKAHIVK
jgi:3-methyl-2-oxobutanoate hydroxymethyltransferase